MRLLDLSVLDYKSPGAWRWRLTDASGRFLADHPVRLDPATDEYQAFCDLNGYLERRAIPDRRAADEAMLVHRIGRWIGDEVLGAIGPAIVALQPAMVRLQPPAEAEILGHLPLELAHVGDRPVALQGVSFVIVPPGPAPQDQEKTPVGERLRMLAIFSLPVDTQALNLRRERYELARLIRSIAATSHKAIELRTLQYGVTRDSLEEVLLESDGWDIVHISGHGLPAGLLLERADGRSDMVSGTELFDLLEPARQQIKLIVLSSCESAALMATEHLRLLGIEPPPSKNLNEQAVSLSADPSGIGDGPIPPTETRRMPALATELARGLDCAVLAMRYPVGDEFAIALARRLYDLLLGKGQPLTRALQLALPKALGNSSSPTARPLSEATPALFGAAALGVRLLPPAQGQLVFDAADVKLADFPPEPKRLVGRVAQLARASAALAPDSNRSGVLFHGMAGAGKTACALELAYRHEHRFARLVWHKAPDEGHDITAALTNLALDLERQLPGLRLADVVNDRDALTSYLPKLSEFLERNRILLVIDSLESLLTEQGEWRDERWGPMVNALVGHEGLSRVILTSRRRARTLDDRVLSEPITALSLMEAVLLAGESPNLGALLEGSAEVGVEAGRSLVARMLAVVQGHPGLIKLAADQAADPTVLEQRLAEADQAWLAGETRLEAFFQQGESTANEQDYLRVLGDWARATVDALPQGIAVLFHFLCALEEADRLSPVVADNWPILWRRMELAGDPATIEPALSLLAAQGLVAVSAHHRRLASYDIHPAVADAVRSAAASGFQQTVDDALATYWRTLVWMGHSDPDKDNGWLVRRAARSATPYLLRLKEWGPAYAAIEQVLIRDHSQEALTALLPLLEHVASQTEGTELEVAAHGCLANALLRVRPDEAERRYRALLVTAEAQGKLDHAFNCAMTLGTVAAEDGRLDEAIALIRQTGDLRRRGNLGPWAEAVEEGLRALILLRQGRNEDALAVARATLETMDVLPEEGTNWLIPWNVREVSLRLAWDAAFNLARWEEALDLSARRLASMRRRHAASLALAKQRFADYGPLSRLGRLDEARELLIDCRSTFEREHHVALLGEAFEALAHVEDELGHRETAIRLDQDALRYMYAAGNPSNIASVHDRLAERLLEAGHDPVAALAHFSAGAVIRLQAHPAGSDRSLRELARCVATRFQRDAALPSSLAELCEVVQKVDGVAFAQLVARLSVRSLGGEAALAEVVRRVRELSAEESVETEWYVQNWQPVIAAIHAAAGGDAEARQVVEKALDVRGAEVDWAALADRLRRILAGERGDDLWEGLDQTDTRIVRLALDTMAGRVNLRQGIWRACPAPALPKWFTPLAGMVIASARGDSAIAAVCDPILESLATELAWADLASAFRRVIAGEREPALIERLSPLHAAMVSAILQELEHPRFTFALKAPAPDSPEMRSLLSELPEAKHMPKPVEDRLAKLFADGERLMQRGLFRDARTKFEEAVDLVGDNAPSWQNLGVARLKSGDAQGAMAAFRAAAEHDNSFQRAWNNLGMLLFDSGRIDEADACFAKGIAADPSYAKCYLGKGNVYLQRGNLAEARRYFELALTKDPGYTKARDSLKNVESLEMLVESKIRDRRKRLDSAEDGPVANQSRARAVGKAKSPPGWGRRRKRRR